MAWTVPPSYTGSQVITQTDLHTGLRDNMRELWHEIAYVEFTANVAVTTSVVDVVSSGALTYVANPIMVEFFAPALISVNGEARMLLRDGATELGIIAGSTDAAMIHGVRRLTPTAASHTYKVSAVMVVNTATLVAGTGGASAYVPGYIRIMQKGGT